MLGDDGPNRVIANGVKNCAYCCYVRLGIMHWSKKAQLINHAQLGNQDKGRTIKGLIVWFSRLLTC